MNKVNDNAPKTYEDWLDTDHIIIPCEKKRSVVKKWSDINFKITKEEWRSEHVNKQMGLRLDKYIDLDIDNDFVKYFTGDYIKKCGAIFGRKNSPTNHYLWAGTVEAKKFILPRDFKNYTDKYSHGATLCEIRHDIQQYTLVPETKYHTTNEVIEWEHFEGIHEYVGNLTMDVGKLALSTALCIIYPNKGDRDNFCTAIAGVLLSHTKWTLKEIDEFIYRIAVIAKDHKPEERKNKGTSHSKANRKLGMPTIAQCVGNNCSVGAIQHLFSWIGITNEAVEGQAAIGDIIEYGQNRYLVKVNAVVNDKPKQIQIIVSGPTLMKQHLFYDEVISQASVWVPKMKPVEFEKIMRAKYEARSRSENYVEEANENLRFKKYFKSYIRKEKAYTDKKELYNHKLPYFDLGRSSIQFNLDMFEDYLESQKINMKRVDLVMKIQMILEGKKIHGKDQYNKSFVYWKIDKPDIDKEDILVEAEVVKKVEQIDYEA